MNGTIPAQPMLSTVFHGWCPLHQSYRSNTAACPFCPPTRAEFDALLARVAALEAKAKE